MCIELERRCKGMWRKRGGAGEEGGTGPSGAGTGGTEPNGAGASLAGASFSISRAETDTRYT